MRSIATTSTLSTIVCELSASTSSSSGIRSAAAPPLGRTCWMIIAARVDDDDATSFVVPSDGAAAGGAAAGGGAPLVELVGKKSCASVFAPVPIMCSRWNSERHLSTCAQLEPRPLPSERATCTRVLNDSMLRRAIGLVDSRYVYLASIVTKASRSTLIPNSAAMWTALAKPRSVSATTASGVSSSGASITDEHAARTAHQDASNIGWTCWTERLEW